MKSTAAVVTAFDEPMAIMEIDVDDPREGEVRVKITASGICGSDVKALLGRNPLFRQAPLVLGHESIGVVESVGTGVNSVSEGDRVLVSMNRACGRCTSCSSGQAYLCTDDARHNAIRGLMTDGTSRLRVGGRSVSPFIGIGSFSQYVVVGESMLVPVGPGSVWDSMALLTCGVVTGFGAVLNIANVRPGETVLVIGCGGVGLNVVQGAAIAGASTIIAVDTNTKKLELADGLGATETLVATEDLAELIRPIVPSGVDHAFDATGIASVLPRAMAATRPGGTTVMIGSPSAPSLDLPPGLFMSGRRLLGCTGGNSSPRSDLPLLLKLARSGRLSLEQLVSERIEITDVNAAIGRVRSGETARSLITFD